MKKIAARKGLSQILYLIIAASVLMMIAMVITFTATDTIGNLGSGSAKKQCTQAVKGQCTASVNSDFVDLPSSCVKNGELIPGAGNVHEEDSATSPTVTSGSGLTDSEPEYADCTTW